MNWSTMTPKKRVVFAALMIVALFIIIFAAVKIRMDIDEAENSGQVLSFSVSPEPAGAAARPNSSPTPSAAPVLTPSPVPVTLENYAENYVQMDDPLLLLVGPKVKIPADYTFEKADYDGVTVNEIMYDDLDRLLKSGRARGANIWLASGFRPQDEQERLLKDGIQSRMDDYGMTYDEAAADALNSFTVPGFSEHHTGLSIDFNEVSRDFNETFEGEWLAENSYLYGFVQRYPPEKQDITGIMYEPWHYRYVGTEHAKAMHELGYCLEEYIVHLKNQGIT